MTDRTRKQVAEKIHAFRITKGMTQKEVATKAGITPNYFALIERGDVSPSNEVVVEIIKSLGVSSKEILGV